MDDEPGINFTALDCRENLVEAARHRLKIGLIELHRQIGGCHLARNSDALACDALQWCFGNDEGPVSITNTRAARHENIVVRNVGVGVNGNRRDF